MRSIITVLVLTSIVYFAADITLLKTAVADSIEYSKDVAKERLMRHSLELNSLQSSNTNRFPTAITGIRQDIFGTAERLMIQLHEEIAKEPLQRSKLPDSVTKAVLQDASKQANQPRKELHIVNAQPQNWPDGCLGVAETGTFCTQVVVPGWKVTVEGRQKSLVYHTNNSGSLVKLARK